MQLTPIEASQAPAVIPPSSLDGGSSTPSQLALLQEIRDNTAAQLQTARRQLFFTRLNTLLLIVITLSVLLFVGILIPRISATLSNADIVLKELEAITNDLSESDLPALLSRANSIMAQGEASMAQAIDQLEEAVKVLRELDIDTLNAAIGDLYRAVRPFSALFGG